MGITLAVPARPVQSSLVIPLDAGLADSDASRIFTAIYSPQIRRRDAGDVTQRMRRGSAIRIVTHEAFRDIHSREMMTANGEPGRLFLAQAAEPDALESSTRTHEFREAAAFVRVDKAKFLQRIQCRVEIRDLLGDDDQLPGRQILGQDHSVAIEDQASRRR